MSRDAEQRLIARAQRGHADAFCELVETYKERLFAFVWRMLRHHHEAEDVCQAAFVKAYESLSSYSSEYAFSTWLFTIGYRICLNYIRKKKALLGDFDLGSLRAAPDGGVEALANSEEARRLRDLIWSAVDRLSMPQKSTVLLFYRESMSCEEIGRILGIPAVTVKSHLHRARGKLRTMLGDELVHDWLAIEYLSDSHFA
ncbi:MAG: ECF RNA polymerase sigma factor SigW [Phycisphaerae bacterium]|nr:ECF RNA polymerase sigma factor SigW [Phycisphaerae bacterium]